MFFIGMASGIVLMAPVCFLVARRIRGDADTWALLAGRYRREIEKIYKQLELLDEEVDKQSEVENVEGIKN